MKSATLAILGSWIISDLLGRNGWVTVAPTFSPAKNVPKGQAAHKAIQSKAPLQKSQQAKAQLGETQPRVAPTRRTKAVSTNNTPSSSKVPKKATTATKRTAQPAGGLPRNIATRGLTMPKGKAGREAKIDERLKRKSPWYQSIKEPIVNADVKIPDSTGVETGTLQLLQRFPMNCDEDGCLAFRTTCLLPNAAGTTNEGLNWNIGDVKTGSVVDWTIGVNNPAAAIGSFSTNAPLRDYAQGVRVVSAAVYAQSFSSLSTNSGVIISYFRPFPSELETDGHSLFEYQNMYKTSITPINNNKPAVVRFLPVKLDGGMYDMFYNPANPTVGGGYDADGPETPFYELGHIIQGAGANDMFEITVCVNYEFIPLFNAINILDAKPSPVDAQEVELVENWVQDMPVSEMVTTQTVAKAPQASAVEEPGGGTGFGMFFEVISELAPLALALL